ncbi:hypothetical protein MF4836_04715 [Pseudomonas sp. MF4836]|nr:hypothetical protein MF4836_04715 [Pseudomonas sp. MF4836]
MSILIDLWAVLIFRLNGQKMRKLFWMKLKKMKALVSLKVFLMSCRKSFRFIGLEAESIL